MTKNKEVLVLNDDERPSACSGRNTWTAECTETTTNETGYCDACEHALDM